MLWIYRKIHDILFHSFLEQYISDARLLLSGVQLNAQEETQIGTYVTENVWQSGYKHVLI